MTLAMNARDKSVWRLQHGSGLKIEAQREQ
jgi:hypothetical protein